MTYPVVPDIEKVTDVVSSGPVAQYFPLSRGLAILGRGDMIDDRLDFGGIEYPILASRLEIIDGHRRGDFMAENSVQAQDVRIGRGLIDPMGIEYLFGNSLSHNTSRESVHRHSVAVCHTGRRPRRRCLTC